MPVRKRKSQKNPSKKNTSRTQYLKKKQAQTGGKVKREKQQPQLKKKKQDTHNKQGGGKLNAFFKLMLDARKKDLNEFKYNGNTYKQFTAKTGLKMYKKA